MINATNGYHFNKLAVTPVTNPQAAPSEAIGTQQSNGLPTDQVNISRQARQLQAHRHDANRAKSNGEDLSKEEREQVSALKKRDVEVKNHEAAHMAAGGTVVQGGASYQYQSGPDGKMYAVGGEVQIDLSSEGTPEATIRKMQEVRRAAMAPAQPSGTDRAVAAQATQIEAQARIEKNKETQDDTESDPNAKPAQNPMAQPPYGDTAKNLTGQRINLNI